MIIFPVSLDLNRHILNVLTNKREGEKRNITMKLRKIDIFSWKFSNIKPKGKKHNIIYILKKSSVDNGSISLFGILNVMSQISLASSSGSPTCFPFCIFIVDCCLLALAHYISASLSSKHLLIWRLIHSRLIHIPKGLETSNLVIFLSCILWM